MLNARIVLIRFAETKRKPEGWVWCIGASIDRLLPLIELNKEFGEFFNDRYHVT